ncbi:hypothetical protein MAPG_02939 [Magnaporthiopsis poae ATCC 64411]|uniref:histone acetyltransferase n=1 Tax=Magnaporthiopsis poae (strain ATCC 64411 / 73-15) TaxID=644358 RepID=A0A0C4DSQ1_MAGP6|nr:hypothetical protein MAPG_02939 [Magnaporthiopsis poae ATCC 64411]
MEAPVTTPISTEHQSSLGLLQSLSKVLPQGYKFRAYHLSTPPSRSDALFSAPPDARPDRTYSESHFLAIAIPTPPQDPASTDPTAEAASGPAREVLVLGLEILIYTTAYSSTFFVSKADSTGFLHLLNLPKDTPSPIREITSAFVDYLVRERRRKGIQSVVSLFARAQGQYLFPGSVEYKGKHVLTDRGLVKWWCKALTPLLDGADRDTMHKGAWKSVKGYLLVPGLDTYETRAFIPRSSTDNTTHTGWVLGHPLERISHYTYEYDWVPPRCLIARYPDDPKSRFRDELDIEADHGKGRNGAWKSVQSLDQFWELMAHRQECSMGALTGFIWIVMDPPEPNGRLAPGAAAAQAAAVAASSGADASTLTTPSASFDSSLPAAPATPSRTQSHVLPLRTPPQASPRKLFEVPQTSGTGPPRAGTKTKKSSKKKKLTGPIVSRQPRVKTSQRNYLANRPVTTAYYHWPAEGRGRRLVKEDGYKRSLELLLRLDFANLELAIGSTRRWINEVGLGSAWGLDVAGSRPLPISSSSENGTAQPAVSNLSSLIKRKKPVGSDDSQDSTVSTPANSTPAVNVLGAGLIRKKRKPNDDSGTPTSSAPSDATDGANTTPSATSDPSVASVLDTGLVRKRPRT